MCEQASWEPFDIKEKEKAEPAHRCYQRCTADNCTDIRVQLFTENTIDILGYDDVMFGNSNIKEVK